MKKNLFLLLVIFFTACTNHETVIEGKLPNDRYNNEMVYWAPFKRDSVRTIDSARIQNHAFRLVISEHNRNKMGIVRLRPLLRLQLQELLVFAEPGTVRVKIDSISSATGTPLNEVLQKWKDKKMVYDKESYTLWKKYRTASPSDTAEIREAFKKATAVYADDIYQIIAGNKDNEAGKFIFSLNKSLLTPEQINKLNINEP